MPTFSDKSMKNLEGIHSDLISLFMEVIKHRDCTIVSGMRTQEEQQSLYAKGRSIEGKIVTHKDGVDRRSYHQSGNAVDVVPYPEMWDEEVLQDFGNFVKGIATMMKRYGKIDSDIDWGFDLWKWDKPHWQI